MALRRKDRNSYDNEPVPSYTTADGRRGYGPRKHSSFGKRLGKNLANMDVDEALAKGGVAAMLTGVSATMMAAGTALFGISPFWCGAGMVALYSLTSISTQDFWGSLKIGIAATAAGFVMASLTPIPVHAVTALAGYAAYHYFHR